MADSSPPPPPKSDRRKASQFAVESDSSSRRESRLVNFIPTTGVTSSNAGRSQNDTVDPSQSRSTNPNAPAPDDIRRAPASLPDPLRAVLQFAIFDTLLEDDDFLTVIRKVLLTVAALFGVFMPGYGAVFLALHGATAANITFALAAAVFFEFVPLFAYVRVTRRVPERAMLATMAAALVALALGAASAPHVPFGTFIGLWAMTMAIIDAPLIAAWYAAAAPALGLAAYNEALQVRREGAAGYDGTPALIGGFDLPTVAERMALHFGAAVIVVCMALVVKAVNGESQFQIAKAKKSAVLARLVSGQLARYQTERARCVLSVAAQGVNGIPEEVLQKAQEDEVDDPDLLVSLGCSGNDESTGSTSKRTSNAHWANIDVNDLVATADMVDGADEELIHVLTEIVDNLEQYRPHLPNWLIQAAMADSTSSSSDDDGNDGERDGNDGGTSAPPFAGGASAASDLHSRRSGGDDDKATRTSGGASRRHHSVAIGGSTLMNSGSSDPGASTLIQSSSSQHHHARPGALNASAQESTKQIAQARVFFTFDNAAPTGEIFRATHKLVDAVQAAATATHAALHSFVGDTIETSWNAASRTYQPAAKATRFLARLYALQRAAAESAENDGEPALQMSGAAAAGPARVLMAGGGITKSLTLSTQWAFTLDALASLARAHDAFVTDVGSASSALDVVTQAVALLRVQPTSAGSAASFENTEQSPSPRPRLSPTPLGLAASPPVLGSAKGGLPMTADTPTTVVEVRGLQEEGDEWMYVLEEKEGRGESTVTTAFELCARGRFADAADALSKLPDAFLSSSPLAARLAARVTLLAERPPVSVAEGLVDTYDPAPLRRSPS